jgi:hypothetical protein
VYLSCIAVEAWEGGYRLLRYIQLEDTKEEQAHELQGDLGGKNEKILEKRPVERALGLRCEAASTKWYLGMW